MYLRVSTKKTATKTYEYWQLVKSYRVHTKTRQKVVLSLGRTDDSHSAAAYLKHLQSAESELLISQLKSQTARYYALPMAAYIIITKVLNLPRIINQHVSLQHPHVEIDVGLLSLLMIIARVVNPDSKLSLSRLYKQFYLPTTLPTEIDVQHFYRSLEYLVDSKDSIEQAIHTQLTAKQLTDVTVVFYDLTSSYFQGEECDMSSKGYSRDHRSDLLQINLGLVIDKNGLPLHHQVFTGNSADRATVVPILKQLQTQFNLKQVIFVADKGMLSADNLAALQAAEYPYILSQSPRFVAGRDDIGQALKLDRGSNFIKKADNLWYFPVRAAVLCFNPKAAAHSKYTRDAAIARMVEYIEEIKSKHPDTDPKRRDMIMKKLNQSRLTKYFDTNLNKKKTTATYTLKADVLSKEEQIDGVWILTTSLTDWTPETLINTYKQQTAIEHVFKVMKDVIELRPIYHYKDDRVKGHVFICVLTYLVIKLLEQKTGQTIKQLKEKYGQSVVISLPKKPHSEQKSEQDSEPIIIGGDDLVKLVESKV